MAADPIVGADLTDGALQDEIELVGDLVVAASSSERPLTEAEIDEVLGVIRAQSAAEDLSKAGAARKPQHA
ncbi:hypothetical protein P0Y31_04665 [Knoellia sp. 3-2P3]|uniref:hypothetical protein n=1 Tax=unclassified Knoellia TaxID=2618719 RepID=UPI0023DA06AC|nr:hypothetical protein [Knoellia sp. 3-2P3]MDF2091625.1 hypothetical protein [Knoellia sp. 3-2P3]